MRLSIPPTSEVVPGSEYKGFVPLASSDPRADGIREVESRRLLLAYPKRPTLNSDRFRLNRQGIILPIGLAFALMEHPKAIPRMFKDEQYGEPVKILTSTVMRSEYDNRDYLAYFYINNKGKVIPSFIAEKPWASMCPSPAIKTLS